MRTTEMGGMEESADHLSTEQSSNCSTTAHAGSREPFTGAQKEKTLLLLKNRTYEVVNNAGTTMLFIYFEQSL